MSSRPAFALCSVESPERGKPGSNGYQYVNCGVQAKLEVYHVVHPPWRDEPGHSLSGLHAELHEENDDDSSDTIERDAGDK